MIIERVNAIISRHINADKVASENNKKQDSNEEREENTNEAGMSLDEENNFYEERENQLYFAPEKNNIVFCSAADLWGFTVKDFAAIWSKKLACKASTLQRFLYGDYYLNAKTKRVTCTPATASHQPMFVQFILNNIWNIYEKAMSLDVAAM